MGLSASVAPGSASWRHMASIIGCRNRCPSWRTITPMTWLDSGLVVEATPVARSWVTSLRASSVSRSSRCPPEGDGVKDRAAQVIHHRGIGREHLLHGRVAGGPDLRRGAGDWYLRDCLGEIVDDQLFNRVPKSVFRSEVVDKQAHCHACGGCDRPHGRAVLAVLRVEVHRGVADPRLRGQVLAAGARICRRPHPGLPCLRHFTSAQDTVHLNVMLYDRIACGVMGGHEIPAARTTRQPAATGDPADRRPRPRLGDAT